MHCFFEQSSLPYSLLIRPIYLVVIFLSIRGGPLHYRCMNFGCSIVFFAPSCAFFLRTLTLYDTDFFSSIFLKFISLLYKKIRIAAWGDISWRSEDLSLLELLYPWESCTHAQCTVHRNNTRPGFISQFHDSKQMFLNNYVLFIYYFNTQSQKNNW